LAGGRSLHRNRIHRHLNNAINQSRKRAEKVAGFCDLKVAIDVRLVAQPSKSFKM